MRPTLALIGFMGSGKSLVGGLVAQRAGVPFRDLDQLVESHAGMSVAEIFAVHGESGFRAMEAELLPEVLQEGGVAALGGGTPMDDANWTRLKAGAVTVFLDVAFEQLWERIFEGATRPLVRGRSRKELSALYESRRPRYLEAAHVVDGGRPAAEVADQVLRLWSG